MKVRARLMELREIPERVKPYTNQMFTSPDREYEIHAISVLDDGTSFLQFVNDQGYPDWKPSMLFDVTDATLPSDWICNPAVPSGDGSIFLLGPYFIAKDENSYNEMVELNAIQVDLFWRRVRGVKGTS